MTLCCSVLQYAAAVLQLCCWRVGPANAFSIHNDRGHSAKHCNTLQHTATHCNTVQHTVTHCNTLQHTAMHTVTYTATYSATPTATHTATHAAEVQEADPALPAFSYNDGRQNAICCNTLQHAATHCNTLQHTATHPARTLRYAQIRTLPCFGDALQHAATHSDHTRIWCVHMWLIWSYVTNLFICD